MIKKFKKLFDKFPVKVILFVSLVFSFLSAIFFYNGIIRLVEYLGKNKEGKHLCMAKLLDCAPVNWKMYFQLAILCLVIFITFILIFKYKKSLKSKE